MDEIGKAIEHGWIWRATDSEGITHDVGCVTVELGSDDGQQYQKVQCSGVPVAYIRIGADGSQAFLLPPTADLADMSDDGEAIYLDT
jgi:hypothetical protein